MKNNILIVSNEHDPHVDFVIPELDRRGLPYFVLKTEDFPQKVNLSTAISNNSLENLISTDEKTISTADINAVWFRRPLAPKIADLIDDPVYREFAASESETYVNCIWDLLKEKTWVSNPNNIEAARNKPYQLKVAAELGLLIPDTILTNDPQQAHDFYERHDGAVILKSIKNQWLETSENGSILFTSRVKKEDLSKINDVCYSPCLFQKEIEKKYELRITIMGNRIFAAELHSQENPITELDWRYSASHIPYKKHELPKEIEQQYFSLVDRLGLRFGAIDTIVTPDDRYIFLEINPNGQWGWIEQKTGLPIKEALVDLLQYGEN